MCTSATIPFAVGMVAGSSLAVTLLLICVCVVGGMPVSAAELAERAPLKV